MPADPARPADSARPSPSAPDAAFRRIAGLRRSSVPLSNAPSPTFRAAAALLALAIGGLIGVALASALLETAAARPLLFAALVTAGGALVVLVLWLGRERIAAARLAARVEAYADANWELEEARAGVPTGDVASGFEPALSIATVSHELRAPLHGVKGLADLLAETKLTAEQRSYVDAIGQSTAALGRVVDDLLDASRIATGHFTLEHEPTAIEPLVEQVAELMAQRAFAKGLGLGMRVARDLPQVEADAGRLRQVLINLVANAISFSDAGGVEIAVEAMPAENSSLRVRFSVSDTGRGVAPADRKRIFASFERTTDGGGAGLGLAISSRILERMGAGLRLIPRAGGGSVFAFELAFEPSSYAPSSPATLAGRRVLVAMPGEPERQALLGSIESEGGAGSGAATLVAAAGLLGAAAAAGQAFDAVLADTHLMGEPGAATAMLRGAAGHDVALVALVEPGERDRLESLRETGFDGYLVRPVRRASLVNVLSGLGKGEGAFLLDPVDQPDVSPEARGKRPLRALVVEDDPVNALLIRAVLEKLGHEVSEAAGTAVAREVLAMQRMDLVLVDLHLGGDPAGSLLRELMRPRAGGARPALIAMSGDDDALSALSAEADVTLAKPVSPDSLRRAVTAACGAGGA